jgi:putative transposase
MEIERKYGLNFNLKKIVRIKKKFDLKTAIRKKNIYRASFKRGEEHTVFPNLLEQNFNPASSETHLSTDITEFHYEKGQKAYLSAVKNLRTKEIVSFEVAARPTIDMVTLNLDKYLKSFSQKQKTKILIHSDQGAHYTSTQYRYLLEKHKVTQSMSRKGNCLDNSPIESFFGHLKDEVDYKACKSFKELKKKIKKYIIYYNTERPQWGLKRKTPAEARVKL